MYSAVRAPAQDAPPAAGDGRVRAGAPAAAPAAATGGRAADRHP
ncbi:hypothetical protein [Streptomyces minutiscleroticus]|nr:hypothetical protein [Streptomyces minutiscleroticus]